MDKKIMKLAADAMRDLNLTEISIKDGDTELFMKREYPSAKEPAVLPGAEAPKSVASEGGEYYVEIRSPMIGIFHAARNPEEMPLVHEGKTVYKGEVLCVIEAMKMITEVKCETNGIVESVYVTDGRLVEYGQPLFKIFKTN